MALEGARWIVGADGLAAAGAPVAPAAVADLERALGLDAVLAAQAGLVADMDHAADVIYGRTTG